MIWKNCFIFQYDWVVPFIYYIRYGNKKRIYGSCVTCSILLR